MASKIDQTNPACGKLNCCASLSGSKPFPCQFCGKSFGRKGNLLEHCRGVHLDEKPFKCHTCGQGFRRKKMLSQHHLSCRVEGTKGEDPTKLSTEHDTHPSLPIKPHVTAATSTSLHDFMSACTTCSGDVPRNAQTIPLNSLTITAQSSTAIISSGQPAATPPVALPQYRVSDGISVATSTVHAPSFHLFIPPFLPQTVAPPVQPPPKGAANLPF